MARPIAAPGSSGLLTIPGSTYTDAVGVLKPRTIHYYGFTLRETGGAAAIIRLNENASGGAILEEIAFLPNETVREFYTPHAKDVNGDIYYTIVSGTVEGSIFHG